MVMVWECHKVKSKLQNLKFRLGFQPADIILSYTSTKLFSCICCTLLLLHAFMPGMYVSRYNSPRKNDLAAYTCNADRWNTIYFM